MDRRKLCVGLMVMASSMLLMAGTASAHGSAKAQAAEGSTCAIHSLPSFVAQGEFSTQATAADVIEVECNPFLYGTGSKVTVIASQLYSRCNSDISVVHPEPVQRDVRAERRIDARCGWQRDGCVDRRPAMPGRGIAGQRPSGRRRIQLVHDVVHGSAAERHSSRCYGAAVPPGRGRCIKRRRDDHRGGVPGSCREPRPDRLGRALPALRCLAASPLDRGETGMTGELGSGPEFTGLQLDNNGNGFVIAIGDASCCAGHVADRS